MKGKTCDRIKALAHKSIMVFNYASWNTIQCVYINGWRDSRAKIKAIIIIIKTEKLKMIYCRNQS